MPLTLEQLAEALAIRINFDNGPPDDGLAIGADLSGGDRHTSCLLITVVEPAAGVLGGIDRTFSVQIKEEPAE